MHTIVTKVKTYFLMVFVGMLCLSFWGCSKKPTKEEALAENKTTPQVALSDEPLADFQGKLLDLAFETASMIPIKPHIKDRSRSQETVITACLKLDQPGRAAKFTKRVDNWRRALCAADLALYCAQRNYREQAHYYLELAEKIAAGDFGQQWRRDRIKVKIAQAHAILGNPLKAEQFNKDMTESETGKITGALAIVSDENGLDEQVKKLDALIALGVFDITKNALDSYTELFNRFYGNETQRNLLEEKIKTSWNKLPVFVRVDLLTKMAGFALDHADQVKTIELVNQAQLLMDDGQWSPEDRIHRAAKLVELRFRAGDEKKAEEDADTLRTLFDTEGQKILDIYRAGALRPLAEAYQTMGNTEAALSVYKQAIEDGTQNPNSRPRAQDLSATCCSMALYAMEPDTELWTRIHQIYEGLGQPW